MIRTCYEDGRFQAGKEISTMGFQRKEVSWEASYKMSRRDIACVFEKRKKPSRCGKGEDL